MKKILALLLGATLSASLAACSTSSEPKPTPAQSVSGSSAEAAKSIEIMHNISSPDTDTYAIMATKWGERIGEATNGGVVVNNFYNNALGENDDVVEQALAGAPIMAGTDPSRLASYVSEFGVIQMPYLFEDHTDLNKLVETDLYKSWVEELRGAGLQVVAGNWFSGARNVLSNKEVRTPADLKGLRLRTIGNDICVGTVNSMGAVATPMAFAEVYQSIQLGGLEGSEMQTAAIESSRMFEVCKVLSKTNHFQLIACEVMSSSFFDSLPAEYQQAILTTGKEMGVEQQDVMAKKAAAFEQEMVGKYGCTVVEIEDLTPFIEATQPLYDKLGFVALRDELLGQIEAMP